MDQKVQHDHTIVRVQRTNVDLFESCAMANLDMLEAFDKELVKEMKEAREDIMEEMHAQHEEEEDSEEEDGLDK